MALRKRRNQADLSGDERKRFVSAVQQMKTNGTYDWYVRTHMDSMAMVSGGGMNMWAHTRPAFLPWHRQFILDFENDLRAADTQVTGQASDLTLPYWDWINYRAKKKFLWWGRIWGDNFMGPNGSGPDNKVSSGPFAGWTPTYDPGPGLTTNDPPMQPFLQRTLGKDADSLPTGDHWQAARNIKTYDVSWFDSNVDVPLPTAQDPNPPNPVRFGGLHSFRNVFEGWVPWADSATALPLLPNLHNRVHVWVGGSMGPSSSPNDPVFFLHHCNVDRLWAQWWSDDPTRPYLPADGEPDPTDPHGETVMGMNTGPNEVVNLTGHHLHDPMPPWDGRNDPLKGTMPTITPADVLNHLALGYGYHPDDRVALSASGTP